MEHEPGGVLVNVKKEKQYLLTYETAKLSTHATEREAWIAHDTAVIRGLNPDALAVVDQAHFRNMHYLKELVTR